MKKGRNKEQKKKDLMTGAVAGISLAAMALPWALAFSSRLGPLPKRDLEFDMDQPILVTREELNVALRKLTENPLAKGSPINHAQLPGIIR